VKFSITINMGNSDSITLTTSEHKKGENALLELIEILKKFPNDNVKRFFDKIYQQSAEGRQALMQRKWQSATKQI